MNNYSKFKSAKINVDGQKFDSKLEYNVYKTLKDWLEPFGLPDKMILKRQETFELQPKFRINGKMIRAITYTADFCIYVQNYDYATNSWFEPKLLYVIDAKGLETEVFKVKKKLFAYKYQREIVLLKSVKQTKQWLEDNIGLPF